MPQEQVAAQEEALDLPMKRYGPGHDSSFYPPQYGAPLLAINSTNPGDARLVAFQRCARNEVFPTILLDGPWAGSAGPRPTSLLQEASINVEYATYANSFGFTLRGSAHVIGAHAFDAWTTKQRPACNDESEQAALRLKITAMFCSNDSVAVSAPCLHCSDGRSHTKLNSERLEQWPAHVALSRLLAGSAANCRFKTLSSMLEQQERFRSMLRVSGLLERCPYAWHAGAISQVATVYDMSHVSGKSCRAAHPRRPLPKAPRKRMARTHLVDVCCLCVDACAHYVAAAGIYVLDWVPSHLALARLAFEQLPRQLDHPLKLIRFSRTSHRATIDQHERSYERRGSVTCSCHQLPWQ